MLSADGVYVNQADGSACYCRSRYSHYRPCRDGTTEVIFEPLDFITRLAVLVPKPRVNLTRFLRCVCAQR
jgi:hypothetical protein|tara:strand:- start:507 stop:716 length:210 start_codon:yes stop_codon:yes gene_type:complete